MTSLKSVLAAAAIVSATMIGSAAAMPAANLITTAQVAAGVPAVPGVQDARWVCGRYRCWRRPNYFNYYGPRWGWGWHRHFFWRRHHWWW
jgi:hypothetical protein